MRIMLRLVAIVIMLGLCAVPVVAQTSSATISGHVVDQSKGLVPNAEVKLIDEATRAFVATTHTNANGDFSFADVNPATYTIIVTAPGYKELRKVNLVHFALQNLDAGTFTLQMGTVQQTVTIQADITPLQTESSERSGVLDTQQTDNLLSVGRDVMAMTKVIPGVVENSNGAASLGTTTAPVVNGVNNEYSMSTIDGAIGNTRGLDTLDTPLNLDAVKEVSVNESNYTAQYGGEAGGMFNYVTKNGTNRFHGGLYEYFRNEDLNANPFFNKYGLTPSTYIARPRYRYNTAGGTIGGPIFWPHHFNSDRSRLFFFVSIEDSPITAPDGLKYYMAPTLLQTQGNFTQTYSQGSATPALINIAYPGQNSSTITGGCPVNGTPNANCVSSGGTYNIIPPGLINAQTQSLLTTMYNATLGNPNLGKNNTYAFNNLAVSDNDYNYITNYSASKPVNQEIWRIDYEPWQNLRMFFRGDLTTVNDNDYSSPANDLPWLMKVNYQNTEPNFVYNIVYTIKPTLVNEFNIGTAGWSEHQLYQASALAQVTLNPSGFDLPSLYAGVNPLNLYPATTFGLSSSNSASAMNYGWDSRFPMADQVRSINLTDQVTKVWRNHTFVAGVELGRDIYRQINHNRVGTFNFSQNTSDPYDTNFAYANANMGVINQYSQDTQLVTYDPLTNRAEWFYQDTWKPVHNLTIDAGIRNSYDMGQKLPSGNNFIPSLYHSANTPALYQYGFNSSGKPVAVDPTGTSPCSSTNSCPLAYAGLLVPGTGNSNNGILYVKTAGYPEGTYYGAGLEWAPRVGFSWSVTPTTVIRSGFGMYYTVRPRSGQEGDLTNNAPTTNGPTQYYSSATSSASNYYAAPGISNLSSPFGIGHALPFHTTATYAEETSLGIQQALKGGIVLDVAYVGTFTKHATYTAPINEVPYGAEFAQAHQYCSKESAGACTASSILNDNFFRPYPGLGSISYQLYTLTANYNSLQVRVTRRFRNGLEFGGAYTFGRAMDFIDSYNGGGPLYQNLRAWEYGPASWDLKHMLVINYLWGLPRASQLFGDKAVWNNVATRQVFDNWQISGFAEYYSGAPPSTTPISLSLSNGQNVTGGGDGARVVETCDPWKKVAHVTRTFHEWFNTGCLENPIAGSAYNIVTGAPATQYSTGNGVFAPKVNYFLPGYTNFDTALFKNFPIESKATLQLRVETYNTFNHTEFNSVSSTATFANANSQGSGNPQTAATFGQLNNTGTTGNLEGPRVMQIALRIDF
jgi:Carboxypeptidase regulatory-like domain